MTLIEIENVIRTHFGTEVEDVVDLPVQYDNDGDFIPPDEEPYLRHRIHFDMSHQVELGGTGNRRYRIPGTVSVSVFGLPNIGSKAALETAQIVVAAHRGKSISGVTFRTPSANKFGPKLVKDRYQVDVDIPFYHDVIE